jgi:hypothetical protein
MSATLPRKSHITLPFYYFSNTVEISHWGDTDIDGRIILRWIFRYWEGDVGTE